VSSAHIARLPTGLGLQYPRNPHGDRASKPALNQFVHIGAVMLHRLDVQPRAVAVAQQVPSMLW